MPVNDMSLFQGMEAEYEWQHAVSSREKFQWNCLKLARGAVLNVGSCDDPVGFRHLAVHCDLDDWSEYYTRLSTEIHQFVPFIQCDAHRLSYKFGYDLFDLVIMGDIIEHLPDPMGAILHAANVSSRLLCMTIWEEWRVPSPERGMEMLHEEAIAGGFETYTELYKDMHKGRGVDVYDNDTLPHHGHLHSFTDGNIAWFISELLNKGMHKVAAVKVPEALHEGHVCMNWCILMSWDEKDTQ